MLLDCKRSFKAKTSDKELNIDRQTELLTELHTLQ